MGSDDEAREQKIEFVPAHNRQDAEPQDRINRAWIDLLPELLAAAEDVPSDVERSLTSRLKKSSIENELKKEQIDSLREKRSQDEDGK